MPARMPGFSLPARALGSRLMIHARLLPLALLLASPAAAQSGDSAAQRWAAAAEASSIVRDDWGIAHVRGKSDADAVFAMIYAQAEDDFPRIEHNYLVALGRLAEAEGEAALWQDLRQRLFLDEGDLRRAYGDSPAWLQRLMMAWADGLNFYLARHPQVTPRAIKHFEPWMALAFSEGSIGGDIERVPLDALQAFYTGEQIAFVPPELAEPKGSNGIAIAPRLTKDGQALLLINPHTSFYFRAEQQVSSDAGLNAYGAATWGQFFIYQGFNERLGWMHTSSGVDNVDLFAERVSRERGRLTYAYGRERRPLRTRAISVKVKTPAGMVERRFTGYFTHHGPIVAREGDRWIAAALMNRPIAALEQSFLRTKASDLTDFTAISERRANSSNNTIIATAKGEIALLVPQFMPKRDDRFDYRGVVDGSDPATDWQGLHGLAELPRLIDPPSGWVVNTNNAPWTGAGAGSLNASAYPRYFDTVGENARAEHALALLGKGRDWTIETLRAAAYDPALPAFDHLLPPLIAAWRALPAADPRRAALAEPMALLEGWDRRWGTDSVPTTLAVHWGEALANMVPAPSEAKAFSLTHLDTMAAAPAEAQLAALENALATLRAKAGDWRVAWGKLNRFQRPAPGGGFDPAAPSVPVGFTSAIWGSLASFGTVSPTASGQRFGVLGNSFVSVVQFGPKLRAVAVTAGGESGDPASPHFNDQAERYASGRLRPVYFYESDLVGHIARRYHPGR